MSELRRELVFWDVLIIGSGTIINIVAGQARCSVHMMRHYLTEDWLLKASEGFKNIKEQPGFTSLPDSQADNE